MMIILDYFLMRKESLLRFAYKQALPVALGALLVVVAGCAGKQSTAPTPPPTTTQSAKAGEHESNASLPGKETTPSNNNKTVSSQPELSEMKKPELKPKLEISQKGATLNWVDGNGKTKMSASLREVRGDLVSNIFAAYDFSGKLYENGRQTASLAAPKVVVDSDNQIVTATGGVTLKSAERNSVVKSSWMKYYAKQHRVVGNGGVKITSDTGTYEGAYFEADTDLRTFTLDSSAKGHKY